jgi:1-deoxy-D-xylulose-5-phosphate reductoisomerase
MNRSNRMIVSLVLLYNVVSVTSFTVQQQLRISTDRESGTIATSSVIVTKMKSISGSDGTGNGWIDPSAPVNSESALRKTLEKSLEGINFQKRLSLLGSTGSIGTQTLDIVDACPNNFIIDALSAGTNSKLMSEQVIKYKPKIVSLSTIEAANDVKERLIQSGMSKNDMPEIVWGDEGTIAAATVSSADTVVTGIVGAAGLQPTIEAIKLKKDIALANKETLISGGPVINPLVEKYGINMVRIILNDSCPRTWSLSIFFALMYHSLFFRNYLAYTKIYIVTSG